MKYTQQDVQGSTGQLHYDTLITIFRVYYANTLHIASQCCTITHDIRKL